MAPIETNSLYFLSTINYEPSPVSYGRSTIFWHFLSNAIAMKIGENLLKKLNKKYEPSTVVDLKFRGYDIALKTDDEGNPILMFIGTADPSGIIKGDRYARRLLKDAEGKVLKDHWDYKGKV